MTNKQKISLKESAFIELTEHILPFWMQKMVDKDHGGFYGRMTGNNQIIADAPKGGILNARILWTFSAAYNLLKDPQYLKMADYSADYIFTHFIDEINGGTWWSVSNNGEPLDTKKQVYSQGFFIYAMVEYYKASGRQEALNMALNLFRLIEKYSFDTEKNGYL